ncbi:hypothetical protein EV356DRAFT_513875 [Viridothelium virens]|uniref:ubiquitinyl hydrolase 1 n=1 Tax=Viridothelium virens TaxID=1048519 RepID=A0A6A6HNL2_VIRVR|nr:hypothetical protein EV356DRAFT_513875 [Viridothelium virens]
MDRALSQPSQGGVLLRCPCPDRLSRKFYRPLLVNKLEITMRDKPSTFDASLFLVAGASLVEPRTLGFIVRIPPASDMQTSSRPQELDRTFHGRRGHSPQISISDDNHHVTEAIGDMYGDNEYGSKHESRPLSFMSTPPGESYEKNSSYFESKRASPPKSPLERAMSNEKKYSPVNGSPNPDPGRRPSASSESARNSPPHLQRSTSETATQPFPLNDIDYESSPAAVAQELSNLQAIRRMSMDVNGADPDLPSFPSNFGNVPTVPPSHSADEDDASRLFWVPARLHPELAPKEFKTFIEDKVERIRRRSGGEESLLSSDGIERQGSGGGLRRKKSMLSRQIDTPNGYEDGAERLERRRSGANQTGRGTNLSQLETLVDDPSKMMRTLSLDTSRKSNDSGVELGAGEDMPILPPAPTSQSLKRSTRTTYRRGSLRKGERVPFSKRAAGVASRSAETDGEESPITSPIGGAREEQEFFLNRVQTEPMPPRRSPEPPDNFSRPRKARPVQAQEETVPVPSVPQQHRVSPTEERPPQRTMTEPPESERPRPVQPKPFHSRIASNGRTTAPLPGYTPPPNVPSIVETPPPQDGPRHANSIWHPERKSSHAPPPSVAQQGIPPRGLRKTPGTVGRPSAAGPRPHSTPPKAPNQTLEDMAGQPSPLPGHSIRTDSLSFIPTFEDQKPDPKKSKDKKDGSDGSRKTSWSWGNLLNSGSEEKAREKEQKERDERELATKRIKTSKQVRPDQKAIDNTRLDLLQTSIDGGSTSSRGRESLVLDRESIRLEEERKKEASSRKAGAEGKKEKDSGLLASIFGGARKKSPSNDHGHSKKPSSLRGLSPDPPPARILKPDIDYNWTRFSILEERAIYRMAHMKLANPRRALYSQVLLSNFMYSYLAKVQQMHPQIQIAGQPGQQQQQGKQPGQMDGRGEGATGHAGQAPEKASDSDIFTDLAHELGVSRNLHFQDVLSIDDPDLVALIPRPVLALILIFPTSDAYETLKAKEDASVAPYEGHGDNEDVIWFKQTIHNACGLYGVLHSVTNGPARDSIETDTPLSSLLQQCIPLRQSERAEALEASRDVEDAHRKAAMQGQSSVPEDAAAEVDYHYICFVKSRGRLYELDGDRKGPVDRGSLLAQEDLLGESGLQIVKEFI